MTALANGAAVTARRLRAAGFRITRQRRAILEALDHGIDAGDRPQLLATARRSCPRLSSATIERMLRALTAGPAGQDAPERDDTQVDASLPLHLAGPRVTCIGCGRVEYPDLSGLDLTGLGSVLGYRLDRALLEFRGLCPQCRGAAPSRGPSVPFGHS